MDRDEIFTRLIGVLSVIKPRLDPGKIRYDSILTTDLGLDSLAMLLAGLSIENEFGIKFEPPVPPVKVSDVVDYILLKLL